MPTRPIAADKLPKEAAQLRPVQLHLRTRTAPMSIAGSRRKLRALPASVIATQHQPLLLPAQALRAMCSITLVMENRCSLSSATFFCSPSLLIHWLAAFHVHDQPHDLRQDPPGDWFAPPIGAAMSRTLFALPPGDPRSGSKARQIHRSCRLVGSVQSPSVDPP